MDAALVGTSVPVDESAVVKDSAIEAPVDATEVAASAVAYIVEAEALEAVVDASEMAFVVEA